MLRKPIAVVAAIVLSVGLATTSANAAKPHTVTKVGSVCKKVGTKTTVKKVAYVCTKNSKTKKLTWTKVVAKKLPALSPECVDMKKGYDTIKSQYDEALRQLADTEAKINAVTGPAGDELRLKFAPSKALILGLAPAVANALGQFNLFCK